MIWPSVVALGLFLAFLLGMVGMLFKIVKWIDRGPR